MSDARALRVCLDLNVYAADLLATIRGRRGTAAQTCVAAVRRGQGEFGALEGFGELRLVVSWGMLTRLRPVLVSKLSLPPDEVDAYLRVVVRAARVGTPGAPLLVLGGTGVMPVRDAEDAHVVDAAIGGRAAVIVTANFADFMSYRTEVVRAGQVAVIAHAGGRVVVAHPAEFAGWVRGVEVPDGVLRWPHGRMRSGGGVGDGSHGPLRVRRLPESQRAWARRALSRAALDAVVAVARALDGGSARSTRRGGGTGGRGGCCTDSRETYTISERPTSAS